MGNSQKNDSTQSTRIPELDGVRGLAILLVLVWHYYVAVPAPPLKEHELIFKSLLGLTWSGVDLFFVLSGFLIGGILIDNRDSDNYFSVFYIRRICRILPLYSILIFFFVIFMVYIGFKISNGQKVGSGMGWLLRDFLPLGSYATFTQNFYMAAKGSFGNHPLGITWSLAIEEQFYLILPFVIRFLPFHSLPYILPSLIILSPICRLIILTFLNIPAISTYVLLPCRMDALLLGVFAAWIIRTVEIKERLRKNIWCLYFVFIILSAGIVLFSFKNPISYPLALSGLGYTWLAVFYFILILIVLLSENNKILSFFCFKPLRILGFLSYFIYLFHLTILGFIHHFMLGESPNYFNSHGAFASTLALFITFFLATVSWFAIEKPIISIGHRYKFNFN
jgi:peptidoglycan/LPS O-acetylase OafA/YrhL